MELDLEGKHKSRAYPLLASLVTPRPLAWVTTLGPSPNWYSRTRDRFEMIRQRSFPHRNAPSGSWLHAPALLFLFLAGAIAHDASAAVTNGAVLVARQGPVEFSTNGIAAWNQPTNDQQLIVRDRLRTLALGQAAVRMQDLSIVRLSEWTLLEILPPRETATNAGFSLKSGAAYFFHRNEPRQIRIETPAVRAGIDGTEFHLLVEGDGRTVLTLIDGQVTMSNASGTLALVSGEQGVAAVGQAPVKTAILDTRNIIQWCLYYPGVLDPDELGFTGAEAGALANSLAAYRSGDLLLALAAYPAPRLAQPRSVPEQMFYLGLTLSSGRVTNYTGLVTSLASASANPLSSALRSLVAAVNGETNYVPVAPATASQFLGRSYYYQSRYRLSEALENARAAVKRAPEFGFGWERVAELEFSLGHAARAEVALNRSLELASRNAQAWALKGFLLLGRDRVDEAWNAFESALEIDARLGNAWLGRGLCQLRRGHADAGLADVEKAAVMEPNRWLFRSYLGKTFSLAAELNKSQRPRLLRLAEDELELAKRQDPLDPTPWLYSALLREQQNRNIEAVRDLERSVALNDNRQVFRSRLLLDEDRSVRGANLARIYERAGLPELSVQEAARAVTADYGNYSPHRFLADSFNALRDPKRVSLRYEEVWSSEQLLANLLTSGGGGSLSRFVSQQEYSTQFKETGTGLFSATEYGSAGDWREQTSHFGTFDRFSYALDIEYQHLNGDQPNGKLDRFEWFTQSKLKLGPDDSFFVQTKYQDLTSGDVSQHYDPNDARRHLRFSEVQDPLLFAGYQHQWTEGVQTLFLGGRLVNDLRYRDRSLPNYVFTRDTPGAPVTDVAQTRYDLNYENRFEIYSAELSQIAKVGPQTLVLGARYQSGWFETVNRIPSISGGGAAFVAPPSGEQDSDMERISAYLYDTVEVLPRFYLTAGVAYDRLVFPEDVRNTPVSVKETERDQVSPKAALQWTPASGLTLRGIYARSLNGVSFEDSVRLEPAQLGGFVQSFRNLIPESLVGSLSGARHDTAGAALDWSFLPGSYLGVQGEWLEADITRRIGVFDFTITPERIAAATTPERLDYRERSIATVLIHHLSTEWSFGARHKFTYSELDRKLKAIPVAVYSGAHSSEEAALHQVDLFLQYEHPSGFYGQCKSRWYFQRNIGYAPSRPEENFWQVDLFAGCRFWRQRMDATVGVLNVAGQDYRLNPLTPYVDLPREREFVARLRINF